MQRKKGRFTVEVMVDGQLVLCHCATTCLGLLNDHLKDGQVDAFSKAACIHLFDQPLSHKLFLLFRTSNARQEVCRSATLYTLHIMRVFLISH